MAQIAQCSRICSRVGSSAARLRPLALRPPSRTTCHNAAAGNLLRTGRKRHRSGLLLTTIRKLQNEASSAAKKAAEETLAEKNTRVGLYLSAIIVAFVGLGYASAPLYKVFCQVTGFGGTTQRATVEQAAKMVPVEAGRTIRVTFDSTVADTLPWRFKPTQREVRVKAGETALAFYTAKNMSDKNITGVATYNVFPLQAGVYFNKIQCFCFEEQRLKAGEEIDMPVFFYIDPEYLDDEWLERHDHIVLSYTFFKTGEDEAGVPAVKRG